MKGFFYLLLNQLSTMQEIIMGDKKKEDGILQEEQRIRVVGRGREREDEGKHYSLVPSKHEMLGYFNKKPAFIWERKEIMKIKTSRRMLDRN